MNDTLRALAWMGLFLVAVLAAILALYRPLEAAFMANQVFNGMIIGVLLVGIALNVRQVTMLAPARSWLNAFRDAGAGLPVESRPRILASMGSLLNSVHTEGFRLSALTMRTMLDSIRLRLDESRELSRYMSGLLIFLGLLGTFWGLLDTVTSVSGVIGGLSAGDDVAKAFELLKGNLQQPLAGMGTAFSSSLFGLGGALVLGFFDLQAGHAQNRFFNHVEDWLSDLIHLPSSGLAAEGGVSMPGFVEALLEQTAEQLQGLQRTIARGEEDRRLAQERMLDFSSRVAELADHIRRESVAFESLAESQVELKPLVARLEKSAQVDDALLEHLRSMDVNVGRLTRETAATRDDLVDGLRAEVRLLARTIGRAERD
ncbi:MAG: flagellar motor protein MotA [Gammaproteobacteria bacterium]